MVSRVVVVTPREPAFKGPRRSGLRVVVGDTTTGGQNLGSINPIEDDIVAAAADTDPGGAVLVAMHHHLQPLPAELRHRQVLTARPERLPLSSHRPPPTNILRTPGAGGRNDGHLWTTRQPALGTTAFTRPGAPP